MSRELTLTAFLSILIFISGSLKLPSPVSGSEFQLSAPIAVLSCACFGFRRYFTAGIIASFLGIAFGTATIFNVAIALVFRLTTGLILTYGGTSLPMIALSGPAGTVAARLAASLLLQTDWWILTAAAIPGMIFTVFVCTVCFYPVKNFLSGLPLARQFIIQ